LSIAGAAEKEAFIRTRRNVLSADLETLQEKGHINGRSLEKGNYLF
jgi:hypothetical protein